MIEKRIRRSEGFFWLGIGVLICVLASKTDLGAFREPGPGFIAFAAGLFIVGVGLIMIFTAFLTRARHVDAGDRACRFDSVSWFRILYTMGLLFGYALLLEPLGYLLTTLVVLWGLFYDHQIKNWFSSFLASLVTTVVFYVFFEKLLGLRFPMGILS